MKTKIFTLFFVFLTSIGSTFADTVVTINDLKYLLNEETKTAKVTFKYSSTKYGDTYYNIQFYRVYDEYFNSFIDKPISWTIDTVNIPSVIIYNEETYDVIEIGEHAFQHCDSLRSITIPSSITNIESLAFEGCNNLTAVHITDIAAWCSINFIGENPLNLAHNLYLDGELVTDLVIPNNITSIGDYAFQNCSSLTSVLIPSNVSDIGSDAFANCRNLSSVILSNGVANIFYEAFYNCDELTSITIPESVIYIARDAFSGTTFLRHVTLNSDSIVSRTYTFTESIGGVTEPLFGDSVETYIIGDGIKKIGDYTFNGSKNLRSVIIPNSVTSIGEHAFSNCRKLNSINIPNSVTSIGAGAFAGSGITTLNLPNSIERIERHTFENSDLVSIEIPNSVSYIGVSAFRSCKSLTSVEIPTSVKVIDNSAFASCSNLATIEIPNGVTSIGGSCFSQCSNLVSVTFPNSLTNIGDLCFSWCNKLDSMKISHNVKSIGKKAFYYCYSLASIELSDSLEAIGDSCFVWCKNLHSITIPANVRRIGYDAFDYSKEIILLPLIPPTITTPSPYMTPYCTRNYRTTPIYVPCGTLEAYMATEWSTHKIQYLPNTFEIDAFPMDSLRGQVLVENNSCITAISAIPTEGNYFVQWSDGNTDNPRTIMLTQDTTITAIFAAQKFIIKFVDDNDTILSSLEYEYGAIPVLPEDPVKTNDAQYSYTFAGWLPQIVAVTSDATYKATYTSTLNKYTITFVSEDSVLSADLWEYGTTPVYRGATPTKVEDEQYTYTFSNWTPEIVSVVEDATYTATFTATEKTEAIDNILDKSIVPVKIVDNGNIYILMPNGKKYSIIGELVE